MTPDPVKLDGDRPLQPFPVPVKLYLPPKPRIAKRRGARGRVRSRWVTKRFSAVITEDQSFIFNENKPNVWMLCGRAVYEQLETVLAKKGYYIPEFQVPKDPFPPVPFMLFDPTPTTAMNYRVGCYGVWDS